MPQVSGPIFEAHLATQRDPFKARCVLNGLAKTHSTWKVDGATPHVLVHHGPLRSQVSGVAPLRFTESKARTRPEMLPENTWSNPPKQQSECSVTGMSFFRTKNTKNKKRNKNPPSEAISKNTPKKKKNMAIGREKFGPLKPSIPSSKVQGFLPLSHLTWTSSTERSPPSPLRAQHQRALGPPPDRRSNPFQLGDIP